MTQHLRRGAFLLALAPMVAFAGPDETVADVPDRAYKFELYLYAPIGTDPTSRDWDPIDAEVWSGVLDCERTEPLVDACVFRDGWLFHGFHIDHSETLELFPIPLDATLEIGFRERGRVRRWDLKGDRSAFHRGMAEAMLQRFWDKTDRRFTDDTVRRMGERLEETLAFMVLGVLDIDRPVDLGEEPIDPQQTWKLPQTPYSARVFVHGVMGSRCHQRELARDGSISTLEMSCEVNETTADGGAGSVAVTGDVLATGRVDRDTGILIDHRIEIAYWRHQQGSFTRRLLLLEPWTEHLSHAPGELPGNPLGE